MDNSADDASEDFQSPVRKSTRKKVQTTHYGHDSPSIVSPQHTSRKSGSAKESHDNDTSGFKAPPAPESDESSDDSIPLSQYSSPVKGTKKGAKSSKKSAKKAKMSRTKSGSSFENISGKGSMFDIIKGGRVALQTVVDDWIESYNNDQTSSMVDLIQLIIQCCGCKGIVSDDMLEEEENVNAIRKLTEEFDEDTHEYPLTMTGANYKKFKNNLCEFIEILIEQCQHSIVYDDNMMNKLISWLISLSDSQVRAFRHTSTFIGMKLVEAIIEIAKKVNIELDNTQRQLDSEKMKSASKRGVQKMEMLQNKKNQLRDNVRELEDFMTLIFQGMFVHRYRDIRPEIRSLCIFEIGTWMKEYSSFFLSHKYLKYVVWTLHDKDGFVRCSALQSLHKLYEVQTFHPQLEPLTSRFKGRIVAMTLDVDNSVTVEAIQLVTLLFRSGDLDEEDCQQVEQLVFCSHRQVSHEAGAFLNERLLEEAEKSSPTKKKASKKSVLQRKAEYLKKLVAFFVTTQIHNHAAYLVDSLWQHCEYLQEWEVMTSILMDDRSGLSDEEETALIDIMTCCCRQAATGQGPPGRVIKRLLSTTQKKTIVNDKQEMSGHFMVQLPVLLGKYGTDLPKAENLVAIAQYFDLEEYSQRTLSGHFEDLLNQVDDLVQKGPETTLLEECAKTYRVLTDNELTLKDKAEVALNKLIDSIVELFKDGYQNCKSRREDDEYQNREDSDDEDGNSDEYAMEVNLRRITAFYKNHDLGGWKLYDTLYDIAKNMNVSDEVCSNALISMEMHLLWKFYAIKDKTPNKREISILKERVNYYIDLCANILDDEVGERGRQAFLCLCDTMVMYSKQLVNNYPLYSSLVYTPNEIVQSACTTFVVFYAFSNLDTEEEKEDEDENTENEVEELNNKRVVLAGLCKLFAYGIFDMHHAKSIFEHFISAFGNFGDIIKHTMAKCREINLIYYTRTVMQTLADVHEKLCENNDGAPDKTSEEYIALKELARRLALTYGIELTKEPIRKAMIKLHREAILHSFDQSMSNSSPRRDELFPNINFFDIINECSFRLIPQDKKHVLKILQDRMVELKFDIKKAGREFQPLKTYYAVLNEGSQSGSGKAPKHRPSAKAKRKLSVDDSRESAAKRRSSAKGKESSKGQTEPAEDDQELPPSVESSPVPSEQEQEQQQTPETSAEKTPEDTPEKTPSTKRKRMASPEESEHEEADNEDDFEESNSVKASSQASWLASQPKKKRPENHSRISYGKAKNTSRVKRASPMEETSEDEEDRTSPPEPHTYKTPPHKRTKRNVPENIFDESPLLESQEDDDLPSGL